MGRRATVRHPIPVFGGGSGSDRGYSVDGYRPGSRSYTGKIRRSSIMRSISTDEREVTLHLADVHCSGCAGAIERVLRTQPAITSVHLDWANDVVQVGYHAGMITPAAIEQLITTTGCSCAP